MRKNIVLFIASLAMFMEAMDATVINTAIPEMAVSLQVNPIDLKLALISYLLSLSIFIPISGWVADKFGVKKVFILAVAMFTASSLWCGFTYSLPQLIAARFMQGLGGAFTLPIGRLIIVRTFERYELIAKMNVVVMVAALGLMLGPVFGGVITHYVSWRWIFWINAPVGLLTIYLSIYKLPPMGASTVPPLDKIGFLLFGVGLALLTYGLAALSESDVGYLHALLPIAVAAGLLSLYTWHSQKKRHPIVNIDLMRIRTFRVSVMGNLFARLGFGGMPFLIPLLLQIGLHYSPQASGLLLAPMALGVLIIKPISLYVLRFFGYRKLLILNTCLVGLSLWTFATVNEDASIGYIASLTFIYGFLIALQYTAMNSLAYANIANEYVSSATSIMSTTQQIAQSFGVAAAALFIRIYQNIHDHHALSLRIFHETCYSMCVLTFLSTVIFLGLKKGDGRELIKMPNEQEKP